LPELVGVVVDGVDGGPGHRKRWREAVLLCRSKGGAMGAGTVIAWCFVGLYWGIQARNIVELNLVVVSRKSVQCERIEGCMGLNDNNMCEVRRIEELEGVCEISRNVVFTICLCCTLYCRYKSDREI
jgi:hypothetical protein